MRIARFKPRVRKEVRKRVRMETVLFCVGMVAGLASAPPR